MLFSILMFPFKTKQFSFQTMLTCDLVKERLSRAVVKSRFFQFKYDGIFYGTVKTTTAKIELGQQFQRNSFRPVIVFCWTEENDLATIHGYYRVSMEVLFTTMLMPLFGAYLSFSISNILPFLILSILWIVMYGTFGKWLFNRDFKWTQEQFLKLMKK